MPIRPSFAVAPGATIATAYTAGRGEFAQRAAEFELRRQALLEQARRFDLGLSADLFSQQQQQQYGLQRMAAGAMFDQMAAAQRFGQQQQLMGMEHQNRLDAYSHQADMETEKAAAELRGRLEGFMGGTGYDRYGQPYAAYSVDQLTPDGQKYRASINNELEGLEQRRRDNAIKPRDYYYALNELMGRAESLSMPRFRQPPQPSLEEQWKAEVHKDPETGVYWSRDRNGAWRAETDARAPEKAEPRVPQLMPGGIGTINDKGVPELLIKGDDVLDQIVKEMETVQGPWIQPDGSLNSDIYQAELNKRYTARMSVLLQQQQGQQPPQPQPPGQPPPQQPPPPPPQPSMDEYQFPDQLPAPKNLDEKRTYEQHFGEIDKVWSQAKANPQQLASDFGLGLAEQRGRFREAANIPFDMEPFDLPVPTTPEQKQQYTDMIGLIMQRYQGKRAPDEVLFLMSALGRAVLGNPTQETESPPPAPTPPPPAPPTNATTQYAHPGYNPANRAYG